MKVLKDNIFWCYYLYVSYLSFFSLLAYASIYPFNQFFFNLFFYLSIFYSVINAAIGALMFIYLWVTRYKRYK